MNFSTLLNIQRLVTSLGFASISALIFTNPANADWFYPPIDTGCPQWQLEKGVTAIMELSRDIQSRPISPNPESLRRIPLSDDFFTPESVTILSYCKERAIPITEELLAVEDERVQSTAVRLASRIGRSAIPVLLELLSKENSSPRLQLDIIEALGIIGDVEREVKVYTPLFLGLLHREDDLYGRLGIATAIGNLRITDQSTASAISDLIKDIKSECLNDDFSCTRITIEAALALGKVGEPKIALEILSKELLEPDEIVYLSVQQAFDIIEISRGLPEGLSTIIALLKDSPQETVRANIALGVGQLQEEKLLLAPALVELLKTETNPNVLLNASLSLLAIGGELSEIASAISSAIIHLDDYKPYADSQVREVILFVARTLGSEMRGQIPVLIEDLERTIWQDDDPYKRQINEKFIINVLREIGIHAEVAKPFLISLMRHDNNEIRQAAIEALGAIETDITEILSFLERDRYSEILPLHPKDAFGGFRGSALLTEPTLVNEVFFIYDEIIKLEAIGRSGPGCRLSEQRAISVKCEYPDLVLSLVSIGFFEDRYIYEYEYDYNDPVLYRSDLSSEDADEDNIVPRTPVFRPDINPWDVRTLFDYHQCSSGNCKTEKSEIFRRLGKAFSRIDPSAASILVRMITSDAYLQRLGYLESEFPTVRRVAVYGLSEMENLSDEIVSVLENVVNDQTVDLDTRRLAAYSLETTSIDVQWFFDQYQLVPYQNFDCRPHHQAAHADFLDKYGGQCESHLFILNGGGSLFDEIKQLLFPSSGG